MKLTDEQIRDHVDAQYATIRAIEVGLEDIRRMCPHTQRKQGHYSWRPGAMQLVWLCSACDKHLGAVEVTSNASTTTITYSVSAKSP